VVRNTIEQRRIQAVMRFIIRAHPWDHRSGPMAKLQKKTQKPKGKPPNPCHGHCFTRLGPLGLGTRCPFQDCRSLFRRGVPRFLLVPHLDTRLSRQQFISIEIVTNGKRISHLHDGYLVTVTLTLEKSTSKSLSFQSLA